MYLLYVPNIMAIGKSLATGLDVYASSKLGQEKREIVGDNNDIVVNSIENEIETF